MMVLFFIAAFHFCLYYCNIDVFTLIKGKDKDKDKDTVKEREKDTVKEREVVPVDLSETKENLEKHLKELKQYNTHG